MTYNSEIFLKGKKEPMIVSQEQAKKIQVVFLDNSIPPEQPLSVAGLSFTKDSIRLVNVRNDGDDTSYDHKPYWVIYSPSRRSIWSKTFESYDDAKKELDYQQVSLSSDNIHDWVIEKK